MGGTNKTARGSTVRLGIVGLDHWYIGLAAARAAADHPDVELVVVAHRDAARARATAARFGAAEATTDYQGVVRRSDLDVVVTACRSSENAALCVEAAHQGIHILSVKPIAMTHAEAARVKDAVERAGIRFFSWESTPRLSGRYRQVKTWIEDGRIDRPISALHVARYTVPTQEWPDVQGPTWWLDPAHVPGGGWLDHAIYAVDLLRWLFGGEVVSVGGTVATLAHPQLPAALEDYGLAVLTFDGGQVAGVEVTWTGAPGASLSTTHLVGTAGTIVLDGATPDRAGVSGRFEAGSGWSSASLPEDDGNPLESMVAALRTGSALPAGIADACRNLDVCLAFYDAARTGSTRQVAP